ncbi:hypothetical protein [Fredinandcohnia quinoae]|uniref:AP2-like integrase N-terminal domain-containing protein n=1 Tax=Fredinandcohnia quinoae TaxID=2918902 RepID=A0AAW5E8G2_9BACI|nr:hypothetical protein [Fredinandcohnia sp. SECRCQ15]MCH1626307.1 hypothetical protein [Fredinandcohnia sp. SECRCQ15]
MKVVFYQAKAGDGVRKKGMRRADTYFSTPEEAASEAISLKARLDNLYENQIQWDYEGQMTGDSKRLKILRGYLGGNRKSNPFYLEILSSELSKCNPASPIIQKKLTKQDQMVIDNVIKKFA